MRWNILYLKNIVENFHWKIEWLEKNCFLFRMRAYRNLWRKVVVPYILDERYTTQVTMGPKLIFWIRNNWILIYTYLYLSIFDNKKFKNSPWNIRTFQFLIIEMQLHKIFGPILYEL